MGATVLKAKRLIDGSGAPPVENPAVLVSGRKIVGVYQGEVPADVLPADATVLEYPEGTLLPGLMDCHVHLNLPGDGTPFPTSVAEGAGVLLATSAHNARVALKAGITALRDCGGMGTTTLDLRRTLELGYGEGSRLVLCGMPITITGGHCRYFGGEADGVEGVRQMARQMVKLGADYIKVMATGGGTPGTMSWLPSYTRAEILAVVDEAHRLGRKAGIHCLCADSIDYAIEAGVDQIEHAGFLIDSAGNQRYRPEVGERLARSGAVVCPTMAVGLYVIRVMEERGEKRSAEDSAVYDRWQRMMEENLNQFSALREAGVRFVAGTDAGWRFTPFDSLSAEMELMQEGGMSAMECLVSATGAAARALGLEGKVGVVRPGLEADIIAVEGNPLERLSALRGVRMVMQAGQRHVG